MSDHHIVGVHVTDRVEKVLDVQRILTDHAGNIKTRLGLHETTSDHSSPHGLLLIETIGGEAEIDAMCDKLRKIPGVQVQRMFFTHPKA